MEVQQEFWNWLFNTINLFGYNIPVWVLVLAGLFLVVLIASRSAVAKSRRLLEYEY